MTNINTAKLIFDISDNVSELLMKQSKNELVTLEDSWKTMSLIESLIDEYDESLLISINRTGSEHNYSTQGFRLEMLGADKILTFETTNSKTLEVHSRHSLVELSNHFNQILNPILISIVSVGNPHLKPELAGAAS
jgi:hypothetical protein